MSNIHIIVQLEEKNYTTLKFESDIDFSIIIFRKM